MMTRTAIIMHSSTIAMLVDQKICSVEFVSCNFLREYPVVVWSSF